MSFGNAAKGDGTPDAARRRRVTGAWSALKPGLLKDTYTKRLPQNLRTVD